MRLRSIRPVFLSSLSLGLVVAGGCVQRKLTVTSVPDGAVVYMNDKEIGRTPIETDFLWYGTYDVQVRKDGYQTLDTQARLKYPWWQIPPIDLFAELAPWHPTDRQSLHFELNERPDEDRPVGDIVGRGVILGRDLESPNRPAATQPATTRPTTQR